MSAVPKKDAFLAAFKVSANLSKAADAVGIDRGLHYRWLKDDPEYAEAFEQAKIEAAQLLEDIAIARATEGLDEPIIYHGELAMEPATDAEGRQIYIPRIDAEGNPVLTEGGHQIMDRLMKPLVVRKRSDALLSQLLKAWLPVKYRENHHIDGVMETRTGASALTDAQLERIARRGSSGTPQEAEQPQQNADLLPG